MSKPPPLFSGNESHMKQNHIATHSAEEWASSAKISRAIPADLWMCEEKNVNIYMQIRLWGSFTAIACFPSEIQCICYLLLPNKLPTKLKNLL